ncbi:MAG TPA: hypothetical protein DG753_04205, partial [Clostridium sp.]|nr:hypothetical protein [Clostridium sp.]
MSQTTRKIVLVRNVLDDSQQDLCDGLSKAELRSAGPVVVVQSPQETEIRTEKRNDHRRQSKISIRDQNVLWKMGRLRLYEIYHL